jgi:hypothetical protein
VSVVSRDTRRRWSFVATGVLALCLLPVAAAARPAPRVAPGAAGGAAGDPDRLRALVLASATRPYQGYAVADGGVGLPELPELAEVSGLLGGSTTVRAWYASPRSWRVAVLTLTGERDIYRTADGNVLWDFERNQVVQIDGELPVRLPWAADVTPPEFARRLLGGTGGTGSGDRVAALPARRIAGVAAAGLRMTPGDPQTTVGSVDVWADPATGLPVQVEVRGRDGGRVYRTRFLELRQRAPDPGVLVPARPDAAGFTVTTAPDVAAAVNEQARFPLPQRLAGRDRTVTGAGATAVRGVAAYGTGLSAFVVLPLPGRLGPRASQAAKNAGGAAVDLAGAEGFELRTSLLTTLVVRSVRQRRTFVLAGPVQPELLRQAAGDLVATGPR